MEKEEGWALNGTLAGQRGHKAAVMVGYTSPLMKTIGRQRMHHMQRRWLGSDMVVADAMHACQQGPWLNMHAFVDALLLMVQAFSPG